MGNRPLKKPQAARRERRTLPDAGWLRLEHPGASDGTVDVPELPGRSTYLKRTLDWWDEVCRSPQASRFTALDWLQLATIVVPLVEAFHREPSTKLAAELRQHQQLYGLSPKDRAALSWRVETPQSGPMTNPRKQSRYAHLQVVDDGLAGDPRHVLRNEE